MLFPKSSTVVFLSVASLTAADYFENLYAREAYPEADGIALSKRDEIYARYAEPDPEAIYEVYERYAAPEPEPEYNDIYARKAYAEPENEFSARDLYHDNIARDAYAEAEAEPGVWDQVTTFANQGNIDWSNTNFILGG